MNTCTKKQIGSVKATGIQTRGVRHGFRMISISVKNALRRKRLKDSGAVRSMNENVQTGRKSGSSAAKQSGDKQLNNKDMDIKNLTDEQKADLMKKLKEDERLAKEKREQDRETFKEIKDEAVRDMFEQLCDLSRRMVELKEIVFARFEDVIALKDEIYKTKSDRQSD